MSPPLAQREVGKGARSAAEGAQAVGNGTPFLVGGFGGLLREGGADGGRHHRTLRWSDVGQRIARFALANRTNLSRTMTAPLGLWTTARLVLRSA